MPRCRIPILIVAVFPSRSPRYNSLQYVGLVTKMKPFDDVHVRQAMA